MKEERGRKGEGRECRQKKQAKRKQKKVFFWLDLGFLFWTDGLQRSVLKISYKNLEYFYNFRILRNLSMLFYRIYVGLFGRFWGGLS